MTREELEKDVAAYLNGGGEITQCNADNLYSFTLVDREVLQFYLGRRTRHWKKKKIIEWYRAARGIPAPIKVTEQMKTWRRERDYGEEIRIAGYTFDCYD